MMMMMMMMPRDIPRTTQLQRDVYVGASLR